MNTIYYANPGTGKRAALRVGQHSYTTLIGAQKGQRGNKTNRLPTMAEADIWMLRRGFVRWPRRKPIPGEQRKAAA